MRKQTLITSTLLFFLFIIVTDVFGFEQIIKGKVFDAEDGKPLPGVTVKAADSHIGTYTNSIGEFTLQLPPRTHTLIFTMVGKERLIREISNPLKDSIYIEVSLEGSSVLKNEVTVIAEDPGARLMRQAIAKKQNYRDSLKTYKYMLYTKFVASTDTITAGRKVRDEDTTIVSILESYSEGYYKAPDSYFNEIIQKRQSANVPSQANFVVFGTNLNAYDDNITIIGEEIKTPFHPDALDYYDFILDKDYRNDEYPDGGRIIVTPKSNYQKLFSGYVNLNPETLFPVSVELYPINTVKLPFDADLTYKQDFIVVNNKFCMPQEMHIYSTLDAHLFWIFSPRLDININTFAYDYKINVPIEDEKFLRRKVEIAESADTFDSTFWRDKRKIVLEPKEARAYDEILQAQENPDSVLQTGLLRQILAPVNRFFGALNRKPSTGLEDIFRYNRVQGAYIGGGITYDIFDRTNLTFKTGYGFSDDRGQFFIHPIQYFDELKQFGVYGKVYNRLARSDDPDIIQVGAISIASFLFKQDYGDYFYNRGYELGFTAGFGQERFISRENFERPRQFKFFIRDEKHNNAFKNTTFALLDLSDEGFRANPPIIEGNMRSFGIELDFNYHKKRRLSNFGFGIAAEISDPGILASDYNFERYTAELRMRFNSLFIWSFNIRAKGGLSRGELPPQKFFSFEAPIAGIAGSNTFRGLKMKEFYGDRFWMINIEHNFGEVIPGIFRIPNVASFGIEFITFANIGWSDFENSIFADDVSGEKFIPLYTNATDDKYYLEAGIGINRLLVFFRVDVGYRFSQVERWLLTISAASF